MISLILTAFIPAFADEGMPNPFGRLQPFTTDGCTDFPNGTSTNPEQWLHCCKRHDLKYWAGGTRIERKLADLELRSCVAATGESEIAEIMYRGVRLGGTPFLPTPWRWGYGWEKIRGYTSLSEKEKLMVLELSPVNPEM